MWGVESSSYLNRNKNPLVLNSDTFMNCDKLNESKKYPVINWTKPFNHLTASIDYNIKHNVKVRIIYDFALYLTRVVSEWQMV